MSPARFAVGTHADAFALPLPPVSQGNLLQRNRRQTVSERQLPCAWLLLQTPLCFRTATRPGLPAPPTRRSLRPHEPPAAAVLSPSLSLSLCFKNNLEKAHFTIAVGRKQKADVEEPPFLSPPSACQGTKAPGVGGWAWKPRRGAPRAPSPASAP